MIKNWGIKSWTAAVLLVLLIALLCLFFEMRGERKIETIQVEDLFESAIASDFSDQEYVLKRLSVDSYTGAYMMIGGYVPEDLMDEWIAQEGWQKKEAATNSQIDSYANKMANGMVVSRNDLYGENYTIVENSNKWGLLIIIYNVRSNALLLYSSDSEGR